MQSISFNTIEEFLDFLPADELKMTEALRKVMLGCVPDVTEYLSYNVLYYKRHRGLCFIWPASVLWGGKKTFDGVRFGFMYGYLLPDDMGFLEKGNRKQVYWKDYTSMKEIDTDVLKAYIYEALLLDDEKAKKGKNKT